jgi:hypothetical protein
MHTVVCETVRQQFGKNANGVIDAQRVGGLAQSYPGNIESRTTLDKVNLDASLGKGGRRRQSSNPASNYKHTPNIAHRQRLFANTLRLRRCRQNRYKITGSRQERREERGLGAAWLSPNYFVRSAAARNKSNIAFSGALLAVTFSPTVTSCCIN